MALATRVVLDAEDPDLFARAVGALDRTPRLLAQNFGVAIAALAHREEAGRGYVLATPPGPALATSDFQRMCDDTWAKRAEFLPAGAEGPVHKPFTTSFKDPRGNNWRNSFDLQGGLGCDAPATEEFLGSPGYLAELRVDCVFRDPLTASCGSPAGRVGAPRTCFNPNKRGGVPSVHSTAVPRPKLFTRGTGPDGTSGYWLVEPTLETLAGLLPSARERVPLHAFAVALYGGSPYWIADGGRDIGADRLAADLGLTDPELFALFDPDPAHPANAAVLGRRAAAPPAPASAAPAAPPPAASVPAAPAPAVPAGLDGRLPPPREIDEHDIDPDAIRVRAGALADPEERARLLERANRGHQRALKSLVARLRAAGYTCREQSGGYDLLATHPVHGAHLFEIKTWTSFNLTKQVRSGWAQLYEYRFRNAHEWTDPPRLHLVLDREPPADLWLWAWLEEQLGVLPSWIDATGALATFPGSRGLLPPGA